MSANQTYNEQELILQVAEGDIKAFSRFFSKHQASLFIYAQRLLGFEAAQDILAESFIKFWNHRQQFKTEPQAYQWLKVTVRNAAYNQLRTDQRFQTAIEQQALHAQPSTNDEQDFYEAAIEAALFSKMIAKIETLPPQQKKIIKMFFQEGMDNAAIAKALAISVQAVKNQKVAALKSLRKSFSRDQLILCLLALLSDKINFF